MKMSKEKRALIAGMIGCSLYVIGDFLFAATGKTKSTESYILYRVCGSTDEDTKRVQWTLGVPFFVWQNVLTCIRSNHAKRRKEVFMPRKIRSNYMEKFKFVYNGRTFESEHKCCNFYGICYRSVMAYQNQYKCRTEEAITHFIELKKSKEIYIS